MEEAQQSGRLLHSVGYRNRFPARRLIRGVVPAKAEPMEARLTALVLADIDARIRACEEIECRVHSRPAAVIPAKAGIHFSLCNKWLDGSPRTRG